MTAQEKTPGVQPGVQEEKTSGTDLSTVSPVDTTYLCAPETLGFASEEELIAEIEEAEPEGLDEHIAQVAEDELQQAIDQHDEQVSREKFEEKKAEEQAKAARTRRIHELGDVEVQHGLHMPDDVLDLVEVALEARRPMDAMKAEAVMSWMMLNKAHWDVLRSDPKLVSQMLTRVCDMVAFECLMQEWKLKDEIDELEEKEREKKLSEAGKRRLDRLRIWNLVGRGKSRGQTEGALIPAVITAAYRGLYDPAMIDGDVLCRYVDDENDTAAGIYVPTELHFIAFAYAITHEAFTESKITSMVRLLTTQCPKIDQSDDENVVVLANGLFYYAEQELRPFDRRFVALSKASVALNWQAENPVIDMGGGATWDVESWIEELSDDDPEVQQLLWEVLGAALRPRVKWEAVAVLYEGSGRNGKGTFLELARALVGPENCTTIPMSDMGDRFGLGRLLPVNGRVPSLVTADENGAVFLDNIENFKSMITHDPVGIEEKNRPKTTLKWKGFMIQCMNELPKTKEKNDSTSRRFRMVPFTKKFRSAADRDDGRKVAVTAIKSDFIYRREVLEYVAKRVLLHEMMPEYSNLSIPARSQGLLAEQQINNDTVREFWDEFQDQFVWDLLPWTFLNDLYNSWMKRSNPNGKPKGKRALETQLKLIAKDDVEWSLTAGDGKPERHGNRMVEPEPLIVDYDLDKWVDDKAPRTNKKDRSKMRHDQFSDNYRGLARTTPRHTNSVHPPVPAGNAAVPVQAPPQQQNVPVQAPPQNNTGT